MKVVLYSDGGARGNPGPAGIGAVVKTESGEILREVSQFIGHATNNVAEYRSLIEGLKAVIDLQADTCEAYMDSELVVKQMKGQYRVKDAKLREYWQQAQHLASQMSELHFYHIPRAQNKEADTLVNQAIDQGVTS